MQERGQGLRHSLRLVPLAEGSKIRSSGIPEEGEAIGKKVEAGDVQLRGVEPDLRRGRDGIYLRFVFAAPVRASARSV